MRILHVASEIFPLVKTGGLADVLGSLPPALARRGLDVRVLLPGLPGVLDGITELRPVMRIGPVFGAAAVTLCLGRLPDSKLPAYVLDAPFLFRRDGNPYTGPDGHDWSDNHRRFGLLGWAAAHLAGGELDPDWAPEVVHAHDWHAGLAPAYIVQNPGLKVATVFTIHNLAFRGIFPMECHYDLGLPMRMTGRSSVIPSSTPGRPGSSTRTSRPRLARAGGSEPSTSARPPVLTRGKISEAT